MVPSSRRQRRLQRRAADIIFSASRSDLVPRAPMSLFSVGDYRWSTTPGRVKLADEFPDSARSNRRPGGGNNSFEHLLHFCESAVAVLLLPAKSSIGITTGPNVFHALPDLPKRVSV